MFSKGMFKKKKVKHQNCSACRQVTQDNYTNPLLGVPICYDCHYHYNIGEFTIDGKNEIYCRWCGEGEGEIILCDSCPKSFCSRCIRNNFDEAEVQRIINLPGRWSCFMCSPESLMDLIKKNGWDRHDDNESTDFFQRKRKLELTRPGLISYDVSRGRERIEIPVINTVDDTPPPLNFVYVAKPVAGENAVISNHPSFLTCCDCTDNCRDASKCQCIKSSKGLCYDYNGQLLRDRGIGIYECNDLCRCNINKCKNRVVGRGPNQRLEVFRCSNGKGWGVRCRDDILPGTFIADYAGEYILEEDADLCGLVRGCDEYLYTVDAWSRSHAETQLHALGMKDVPSRPLPHFMVAANVSEDALKQRVDPQFADWLISKGVVDRAKAMRKMASTSQVAAKVPNSEQQSSSNNSSTTTSTKVPSSSPSIKSSSWLSQLNKYRLPYWEKAQGIIMDKFMDDLEEKERMYVIDARWYGSVARFLNHSCEPNLDKVLVFCDSQDVRVPR